MAEVDLEALITVVHDRPILWDKTQQFYKDRIQTKSAWVEAFKELNDGFENLCQREKNDYGKAVMKKWANVRDAFQRSERNYKVSLHKSGSAKQPPKTYLYAKQLQFLKKFTEGRPTENSFSDDARAQQSYEHYENEQDGSNHNEGLDTESAEEYVTFKKPRINNKRKPDQVEVELISAIKQKPGRHSSFFNGIIPSLETFDDDEIVEFQLRTLQILSDIKKRKKASANIKPTLHPSTSDQWQYNDHQYHIVQTPSTATQLSEGQEQLPP